MNIDTSAKTPGWSSLENYDAPGGSVMTFSEVSHSNGLEQYVSHEHLVTLFYDKERAGSLAAFSVDLLAKYPDYPYHQAAHGVDVMRSLRLLLTDIIPADSLSLYQKDLLLQAAAAHDAGLAVGPPPYGCIMLILAISGERTIRTF